MCRFCKSLAIARGLPASDGAKKIRTTHSVRGIVRASPHASRIRRRFATVPIAQIACGGLTLRNHLCPAGIRRIPDCNQVAEVLFHGDIAVRAVLRAEPAANAVIRNNDLFVFAPVDGIDRTADHAIGVFTGTAGCGNQLVSEAQAFAVEPRQKFTVRDLSVLFPRMPGCTRRSGCIWSGRGRAYFVPGKAPD